MPDAALLGAGGAGDADVAEYVGEGHASALELSFLRLRVHPRDPLLELATGTDVAENQGHARNICLWNRSRNGKVFRK